MPDFGELLRDERKAILRRPTAPAQNHLFHYTSAEACFSILQVTQLWASSAFCMNDTTEIECGLEVVHQVAEGFIPQPEIDRYFARHHRTGDYTQLMFLGNTSVVSFCAAPDLLSQ
jgi:hypothetical protein